MYQNTGEINVTKCENEILQLAKIMKKSQDKYFLKWYIRKVDLNTKALMPAEEIVKRRLIGDNKRRTIQLILIFLVN